MTRSKGFTLIELLVVVAVIGIIAAIGIVSYNGYLKGAKMKAAENVMQQISLGQTENYSDNGMYYMNRTSTNCSPTSSTSTAIETNLLGGSDNINDEMRYQLCIANHSSNYLINANEICGGCEIEMTALGVITRRNC